MKNWELSEGAEGEGDYFWPHTEGTEAQSFSEHRGHGDTEFFRTQRRAGARGEGTEQSIGMEGAELSESAEGT
jgi:hypothetical protein